VHEGSSAEDDFFVGVVCFYDVAGHSLADIGIEVFYVSNVNLGGGHKRGDPLNVHFEATLVPAGDFRFDLGAFFEVAPDEAMLRGFFGEDDQAIARIVADNDDVDFLARFKALIGIEFAGM